MIPDSGGRANNLKKSIKLAVLLSLRKNVSLQPLQDDARSFFAQNALSVCVGQLGYMLYNETWML